MAMTRNRNMSKQLLTSLFGIYTQKSRPNFIQVTSKTEYGIILIKVNEFSKHWAGAILGLNPSALRVRKKLWLVRSETVKSY